MDNRLKLAAAAALVVGVAVLALALTGVWPGPSAADRERSRALYAQAGTALQSGDQDGALRALSESIRLDPQNDALRMRASLHVARNDYDAALRDLNKVISRGGGLAANYSLRCWLRARGGELDGARGDCDRALEIDPALAGAFGNRGLVGLKQGRYPEAWEDFNTALRVGGSDEWVAWRLFGRGVAAWGGGRATEGRQDIEQALRSNAAVAAQFAEFGVGGEVMGELETAAYAAATSPRSLLSLQQYMALYPGGAHAAEAQALINEIYARIAEDQAAGQRTLPGFSMAQIRGSGPASDSFGAIAMSRSTWRVAFATDYATGEEAERAAAGACNNASVRDCDAYAFRNVCAALAISPSDRARGLAWAYAQDDAVDTAVGACRSRGGRACVSVHSQCTPTPPAATPAASPG
jgi:tetratricopeptide (TPR) repeat protein